MRLPSAHRPLPRPVARERVRLLHRRDVAFVCNGFRQLLPAGDGVEPHLRGAIRDALEHPGSLLRAQVAFGLLRAWGCAPEPARAVAVAVEYFHTASLIFDDLPSMDDARERRGHPCSHLVHGEAAATLGALALITQGYALLWPALSALAPSVASRAAELVSACLGVRGILNGQARDLHFAPSRGSEEEVLGIAAGKTASLIRLAVVLPALISGAGDATLEQLERLATAWGLSYQILDDCKDCWLSSGTSGKSAGRDARLGRPNLLAVAGTERAMDRLSTLLAEAQSILARLPRDGGWELLDGLVRLLDAERQRLQRCLPAGACA